MSQDKDFFSELRQNPVSGGWINIAPKRDSRPRLFNKEISKENCPFENPEAANNLKASVTVQNLQNTDWAVKVLPNKFPVLKWHVVCPNPEIDGPYLKMEGVGFHDLIITRDHERNFPEFSPEESELVFKAFQERYRQVAAEQCVKYVSIFHNHGMTAGASVPHPHSQMIALPIIPPDVQRSLKGSSEQFEKNGACIHCVIMEHELKYATRLIYQNDDAAVFCPFASQQNYEVRIFPKKHHAFFEDAKENLYGVAEALNKTLKQIKIKLDDPDYNFFIHTAPTHSAGWDHYHWHIEIQPKINIWGGFELGTNVRIVSVTPEEAADTLKAANSKF